MALTRRAKTLLLKSLISKRRKRRNLLIKGMAIILQQRLLTLRSFLLAATYLFGIQPWASSSNSSKQQTVQTGTPQNTSESEVNDDSSEWRKFVVDRANCGMGNVKVFIALTISLIAVFGYLTFKLDGFGTLLPKPHRKLNSNVVESNNPQHKPMLISKSAEDDNNPWKNVPVEYYHTEVIPEMKVPMPRMTIHIRYTITNGVWLLNKVPEEEIVEDFIKEGICYSGGFDRCPDQCKKWDKTKVHYNLFSFEFYQWFWDKRCFAEQEKHYKRVEQYLQYYVENAKEIFGLHSIDDMCTLL
eukprot:gene15202-16773_t